MSIRSRTRRRLLASCLIAATIALGGCSLAGSTAVGDGLVPTGTYALESIDGRTLPTGATCGVFDVIDGTIVLQPDGVAVYVVHYAEKGTNREVTYASSGTVRREGSRLLLDVIGRWSNGGVAEAQTVVLDVGVDVLRHGGVGAACDASSVETYRLLR